MATMAEDVESLTAQMSALQAKLVAALQSETYCEDVVPPPEAFGWSADHLRAYFESGGSELEPVKNSNQPKEQPGAAAITSSEAAARKVILLLGDSHTDLGARLDEEGGPGWVSLLTRDYQANRQCDVLNRGFSGWNSRWLLSELG